MNFSFILANSADFDEMLHSATFHLGLHSCQIVHLGISSIHRGSYMSAHVLLNLLNELRKIDKIQGLPISLLLFRNEFNKFNKTRALILDSIYHTTLRLF